MSPSISMARSIVGDRRLGLPRGDEDPVCCWNGAVTCRGRHRLPRACRGALGSIQIRPRGPVAPDPDPVSGHLSMARIVVSARTSGREPRGRGVPCGRASRATPICCRCWSRRFLQGSHDYSQRGWPNHW